MVQLKLEFLLIIFYFIYHAIVCWYMLLADELGVASFKASVAEIKNLKQIVFLNV